GSDTLALGATVSIGLAVTSHDNSALATATFDHVSVTPAPPSGLPAPWLAGDIGNVALAGEAAAANGTWTVRASGADIWDAADAFHYVSQPLTGDGTIVARVVSLQGADPWTKAGLMIRDTRSPGSAHAFVLVTPGSNGVAFQRRVAAGGLSTHTSGPTVNAPVWLALVRNGGSVTASWSWDGITWTPIGSDTLALGATVSIGLAVTSHDNSALATATFDHVSVTPAPMP
ncbi:MAG TPA: hypothetical protein VFZ73_18465, partial [Gemmatimonadaceae bacterium]